MRPRLRVRIGGRQLIQLQNMCRQTRCARIRLRAQMALFSGQGCSVEESAKLTRQSDDPVRHWLPRFVKEGCAGLYEAPRSDRPPEITPAIERFLLERIPQSPRDFPPDDPLRHGLGIGSSTDHQPEFQTARVKKTDSQRRCPRLPGDTTWVNIFWEIWPSLCNADQPHWLRA